MASTIQYLNLTKTKASAATDTIYGGYNTFITSGIGASTNAATVTLDWKPKIISGQVQAMDIDLFAFLLDTHHKINSVDDICFYNNQYCYMSPTQYDPTITTSNEPMWMLNINSGIIDTKKSTATKTVFTSDNDGSLVSNTECITINLDNIDHYKYKEIPFIVSIPDFLEDPETNTFKNLSAGTVTVKAAEVPSGSTTANTTLSTIVTYDLFDIATTNNIQGGLFYVGEFYWNVTGWSFKKFTGDELATIMTAGPIKSYIEDHMVDSLEYIIK